MHINNILFILHCFKVYMKNILSHVTVFAFVRECVLRLSVLVHVTSSSFIFAAVYFPSWKYFTLIGTHPPVDKYIDFLFLFCPFCSCHFCYYTPCYNEILLVAPCTHMVRVILWTDGIAELQNFHVFRPWHSAIVFLKVVQFTFLLSVSESSSHPFFLQLFFAL